MADRRIKDIVTTATSHDTDDYLALDGSTNGTRKILWDNLKSSQAMGAIYITTPAATTPPDTTNFTKILGTTALNNSESVVMDFDMPANNRLRYTGTNRIHAHIAVTLTMTAASTNQVLAFRIYKYDDSGASGATLVHSNVGQKIGTGTDVDSTALHADCLMDTNDYIEVHLKNTTSTDTVTLDDMYMSALGVKVAT
jgi:hypothetical protein